MASATEAARKTSAAARASVERLRIPKESPRTTRYQWPSTMVTREVPRSGEEPRAEAARHHGPQGPATVAGEKATASRTSAVFPARTATARARVATAPPCFGRVTL